MQQQQSLAMINPHNSLTDTMITTSFAYGDSYGVKDHYNDDDRDYDDFMSAEDYDRRRALRDGWASDTQGRW
jgi:hypothetical protein